MDQHFKILHAHEEILCLNIEIPRVITYMRDEEAYLLKKKSDLWEVDPLLSNQILLCREDWDHFNNFHLQRFCKLSLLPGFTGSLLPGVSHDVTTDVINTVNGESRMENESKRAHDAGMVGVLLYPAPPFLGGIQVPGRNLVGFFFWWEPTQISLRLGMIPTKFTRIQVDWNSARIHPNSRWIHLECLHSQQIPNMA